MSDIKRTVLWSADTVQPSNTSITLNDSIDNYDEIIYYGSGTRTYCPCVMTEYPVISGVLNLGGPLFIGKWGSTDGFVLCNGTQVFLSGTSGFVASSYYWGKNAANTDYAASLVTNRTDDVRPYMIVGVKYPNNYDRTLIWSSEHTAQLYNTNITLDETVNHFDEIMVLGSGFENGGVGCRHASKNIYNVQDKVMGCDAWAYTPWKLAEKHNLVIGQEMRLSGNSGYIGSGYFMGMGNQTNAWAAGKWDAGYQFSGTAPYAIYGLKRRPTYNFYGLTSEGGSVSSNINPGYSGDIATIAVTPASDVWRQSALNITGAELTGNDFMFGNSNVTASAGFEHSRDLTLENGEHGVLSADKMTGFSGDVVTVDATTDEGWYFTGLNVTGATATGNQFMFVGNDVTAEGLYTDAGYPITYLSDEHVSVTGDDLYIPGTEGIQLQSSYDTYYRIDWEITNGSIVDGKLVPTGPCTVYAKDKINYFTATGGYEKGSNQTCSTASNNKDTTLNISEKYAIHASHTGDIPASWYSTSNRWKPNGVSAYSITLHPVMKITVAYPNQGYYTASAPYYTNLTGVSYNGSTATQQQTGSFNVRDHKNRTNTFNYNKTYTTTTQNINYGLSGKILIHNWTGCKSTATYQATGTTGTWTATGIAP